MFFRQWCEKYIAWCCCPKLFKQGEPKSMCCDSQGQLSHQQILHLTQNQNRRRNRLLHVSLKTVLMHFIQTGERFPTFPTALSQHCFNWKNWSTIFQFLLKCERRITKSTVNNSWTITDVIWNCIASVGLWTVARQKKMDVRSLWHSSYLISEWNSGYQSCIKWKQKQHIDAAHSAFLYLALMSISLFLLLFSLCRSVSRPKHENHSLLQNSTICQMKTTEYLLVTALQKCPVLRSDFVTSTKHYAVIT